MTPTDDKTWRLENARPLRGAKLRLRTYAKWSDTWDHDHCAACWATLAVHGGPDVVHAGYATTEEFARGANYEWVCPTCFADLADAMGWTAVE